MKVEKVKKPLHQVALSIFAGSYFAPMMLIDSSHFDFPQPGYFGLSNQVL
jgi:hypothetical protein